MVTKRKIYVLEVINLISIASGVVCTDELVPVLVERQLGNDTIYFRPTHNVISCDVNDKVTYLVDDKMCVSNQELLNGCMFTIASIGTITHRDTIAVYMEGHQNTTITLMTAGTSSSNSVAIITYRKPFYRELNIPLDCRVDSLEVYRGRKHITKISHDGFSINENGNIQVNQSVVASRYSIGEFKGELYRLNVTCSDQEGLESGCLFFKVIGESNITKAKFGGAVSGTIQTSNVHTCTEKMDESLSRFMTIDIVTYSVSAVAVFLILLFIVVLICTACCYYCTKTNAHRRSSRENQTSTAIPSKLKRELDISYLISAAHNIEETTSSRRPSLSGHNNSGFA